MFQNPDIFFTQVRKNVFGGFISQKQVDGINAIIAECEAESDFDHEQQAYILATAYWESAHTMAAIEEYGKGAGHSYGAIDPATGKAYFGRGLVQLTWKSNYEKMGALLGLDLVNHPELALDLGVACKILVMGMLKGLFVPAAGPLSKYLVEGKLLDWIDPRHEVNGNDHEAAIATIAQAFYAAIQAAVGAPISIPATSPAPTPVTQPVPTPAPILNPGKSGNPPANTNVPVSDPNPFIRFITWIINKLRGA